MVNISWFEENLLIFIFELKKQIKKCVEVIEDPSAKKVEIIQSKDAQLNNLKRMIENRCFNELAKNVLEDKQFIHLIRGIHNVAGGLEKIGDYTVSIANQTLHLADKHYFKDHYNYKLLFEIVENGLDKIQEALFHQRIETGVLIGKSEVLLDYIYESKIKEIISNLQSHQSHTSNLVTSLFIFHYLERMGDTLLNIGESIVSAAMGENLKIDQVNRLKDSLGFDFHEELKHNEVKFRSIWGTRSGCRIGEVVDSNGEIDSIFKDGDLKKLKKEKESIENWNKLFPGTAPQVLSFNEDNGHSTILLERIYGKTLKETIINSDVELLPELLGALDKKLTTIWDKTLKQEPISSNFTGQLLKRLPDIYFAHSELNTKNSRFGDVKTSSFEKSLTKLTEIEKDIQVPFTILGHGDFNIDNIIYNPETDIIHYIDLHRSGDADYVQDMSVFLISCFRLPVFIPDVRELINETISRQYDFASEFAVKMNDDTFHYRLALGLVRSLTTSTRFELNKEFAKEMFLRSSYLTNLLIENANKPENFGFPIEILHYE